MADKNYPYIMPEYDPDDYPKKFSDLTAGDVVDDSVTGANIYGIIDYFRSLGKEPSLLSKMVKPSNASKILARINPVTAGVLAAKDLYDIGKAGYTGYQMLQSQAEARKSQEDYEKALKESEARAVRKKSLRPSPVNLREDTDASFLKTMALMQSNNAELQQKTALSPEEQDEFNSITQQYKITGINVPEFNS